jgi:hypothetical protein
MSLTLYLSRVRSSDGMDSSRSVFGIIVPAGLMCCGCQRNQPEGARDECYDRRRRLGKNVFELAVADAAALLEALRCADIAPVRIKSVEQQALQALHRTRSLWMATRTVVQRIFRTFIGGSSVGPQAAASCSCFAGFKSRSIAR